MSVQTPLTQFPAWQTYGHDWAVDFLATSLRTHRARHAYLIVGSHSIGKSTLAQAFVRALNCTHESIEARPCGGCRSCRLVSSGNHPDVLFPQVDDKNGVMKIDALRDLMKLLALKPFESRYRVAILPDFERVQPRVQDALLKTLEEPPPHAVLIVMAQSLETVLPTIKSRCQMLPLKPAPTELVQRVLEAQKAPSDQATLIARLSSGRMGWALEAFRSPVVLQEREDALALLSDSIRGNRARRFAIAEQLSDVASKDRDALRYLLEMWQTYWRDVLLLATGSPIKPCNSDKQVEIQQFVQRFSAEDALHALNATRDLLYTGLATNANLRLALEAMLLEYPFY